MKASKGMENYFNTLKNNAGKCYSIARGARKKNLDPETFPEIPSAEDLAARVEKLVGPKGVAERIRVLDKHLGREEMSIQIAKEIVHKDFKKKEDALEQAIRTGLAVLTEGVLVAPLDGISDVKIKKNFNGSDYLSIYFAGPIRSAGGTAQAMSVLIADVVRRELGLSSYVPTNAEIERYKEEIPLYKEIQHLQYVPSSEEISLITSNCPVCIDGEGTEKVEVFGNRDLSRVETNRVRSGMCLVIAEGLCLKAPKIQKHVRTLGIDGWDFIDKFVGRNKNDEITEITPDSKYMHDVVAGRPVFSAPSRKGGFRLRYGRSRNSGLAAVGVNPATMYILDDFLAVGTQLKTERPGKAGAVVACDSIDGPVVLLKNNDLIQINSIDDALKIKNDVKEIIDLGEILISYGEFLENNHLLMQGSYCTEWWEQEAEKKIGNIPEEYMNPSPEAAFKISEKYNIPLHPKYCLFWEDLSKKEIISLRNFILRNGEYDGGKLYFPYNKDIKEILIKLCALHKEKDGKIVIESPYPLIRCCGLDVSNNKIFESAKIPEEENVMKLVSSLAGVQIRERSPSRIGSRMGRPEKAKERKMSPPVHVLFPLGKAGGVQRLVKNAVSNKTVRGLKEKIGKSIPVDVGLRICESCKRKTFLMKCECGGHTRPVMVKNQLINVGLLLDKAKTKLNEPIPDVKGVIGMISKNKTPESIEKGILRAKHNIFVYKDGTVRFDMTDVPLTHFKPSEIGTRIKKLKEMGYTCDYNGNPLKNDNQILELKPQDIIVSKSCIEYLYRVSGFVDDLLKKFYDLKPFYSAKKPDDMIGHLIIGLSPHTSAGVLGRIIGWTNANVCFAHPFYHAAKRRNCDGDEDCVMLLLDALLNFSKSYLPDKRGGMMDAPLLLTTRIDPKEIDKEALNFDTVSKYPLEFYEAGIKNMHPKEIEKIMDNVKKRIGNEKQYENFSFTHNTDNIASGPLLSAYKTLGSMVEKMDAQLSLALKIRAVDAEDVASKIINTHFLPDMIGNLRTFATQKFRCTKCNTIYRRMPLKGVCLECGGNITMTVHEGGVKKYLKITKQVAEKYNVSNYTMQRVLLMENAINSLFHNDKINKCKLEDFL